MLFCVLLSSRSHQSENCHNLPTSITAAGWEAAFLECLQLGLSVLLKILLDVTPAIEIFTLRGHIDFVTATSVPRLHVGPPPFRELVLTNLCNRERLCFLGGWLLILLLLLFFFCFFVFVFVLFFVSWTLDAPAMQSCQLIRI